MARSERADAAVAHGYRMLRGFEGLDARNMARHHVRPREGMIHDLNSTHAP